MSDSPSSWLRSLAAEATRVPDPYKDSEEQWIARGRAINQARKLAPDLAVLCADAIEWIMQTESIPMPVHWNAEAVDIIARFAALQPDNQEEGT